MRAKDFMTSPPITASLDTPVEEIAERILEQKISAIPIVDNNSRLRGIVSASDLIQREEIGTDPGLGWLVKKFSRDAALRSYVKSRGTTAAHVMSTDMATVGPEAELVEVVRKMSERGIQRIIVEENGEPVGILSRRDVLRAVLSQRGASDAAKPDDELHEELLNKLRRETWFNPRRMHISISEGIVTLDGIVHSKQERAAFNLAAQGCSGVRAVKDRTVAEFS